MHKNLSSRAEMQDVSSATSFELVCPSFSAYFADGIAQTAARVRHELLAADLESPTQSRYDDDFEFASPQLDPHLPSLSSFPIFSLDSSVTAEDQISVENRVAVDDKLEPLRISFGKLLVEDGDPPSSSSSGEEELERVPRVTFCMWSRRRPAPSSCRKSNSTGSSSGNPKRWRLTDLILRRSNSDCERLPSTEDKKRLQKVLPTPPPSPSPHVFFYGRKGMKKEGERRGTYLPYRKDLVGIFANGYGLGRNIPRS